MKNSGEDLSARARRGELSASERQRLELLLKSSLEARLLHRAGCEFDAEDSVQPGDDAAAERLIQRVLTHRPPNRGRQFRLGWVMVAAAVCVATAAAAGVVGLRLAKRHEVRPHSAPLAAPQNIVQQHKASSLPVVAPPSSQPAPSSATLELPKPKAAANQGRAAQSPEPQDSSTLKEASKLFADAARARREGDFKKAIVLYDTLQNRYPGSAESRASDIALGMLHAKRAAPAAALEHFERYLRHSPRGELAPEALWGQAQALLNLGRNSEARRSLTLLLERYPDSAYESAARAKLGSEISAP